MAVIKKDIGAYSAYAIAVKYGYKGTEAEWNAAQEKARADSEAAATRAEAAAREAGASATAAETAAESAGTAKAGAEAAKTAAEAAQGKAEEAQEAAQQSAADAAGAVDALAARLKSGALADAELHLGFYIDEDGDLCQRED